jgi:proline-specific peptidase
MLALLLMLLVLGCSQRPLPLNHAAQSDGFVDAEGGVKLHYRILGSRGDTIVVIHGGPGFSMGYIAPDIEPLSAHHVLLFYDQRGTGNSTLVSDSVALDASRFADDLEAVRRHFKISELTLFAHSWGAGVAALYASKHPQHIGRLIIVDPISVRRMYHGRGIQTFESRRDSAMQARLRSLASARLANPSDAAACRAFYKVYFLATLSDTTALSRSRGDFCAGSPEALANKVKNVDRYTLPSLGDWDWRPALQRLRARALIIRGTQDHVLLESAQEWAQSIPNAKLLEFQNAGHFPYIEAPDRFFVAVENFLAGGEGTSVMQIDSGATATIVAPAHLDRARPIDLILYALPNGNSTEQTIGRKLTDGMDWHFDIQNIGAQTRALRSRGLYQAVVAYLEAEKKSWPEWRRTQGYDRANKRIVRIVSRLRSSLGKPRVTLTGHSGGGSLMFGFIEGEDTIPSWIERIAFLDANYNFDSVQHGSKLMTWLSRDSRHKLVVLAYDDRNIMLDGKKVVSDSGGTWRASERMMSYLKSRVHLEEDKLGEFRRYHSPQIEILVHPNPENRILHTEMIGEMNGYMHALLVGRPDYDRGESLLKRQRAYTQWIEQ